MQPDHDTAPPRAPVRATMTQRLSCAQWPQPMGLPKTAWALRLAVWGCIPLLWALLRSAGVPMSHGWLWVPLTVVAGGLLGLLPGCYIVRVRWEDFQLTSRHSPLPGRLGARFALRVAQGQGLLMEEGATLIGGATLWALVLGLYEGLSVWTVSSQILVAIILLAVLCAIQIGVLAWALDPAPEVRASKLRPLLLRALLWRAATGDDDPTTVRQLVASAPDPAAALKRLEEGVPLSTRSASPVLRELLRHPDREVRLWALQAIGATIGAPPAPSASGTEASEAPGGACEPADPR